MPSLTGACRDSGTWTFIGSMNKALPSARECCVAAPLHPMHRLTSLSLSGNELADKGMICLSEAAVKNDAFPVLEQLSLVGSNIGDASIAAFTNTCKSLKRLSSLLLHVNRIGDRGVASFTAGMFPQLQALYLNDQMNDQGDEDLNFPTATKFAHLSSTPGNARGSKTACRQIS
eukprot:4563151-Prymnesium_polylepis.1